MNATDKVIKRVLHDEGWYCDWAADAGGETWRGITRKYQPEWPGWKIIDQMNRSYYGKVKLEKKLWRRFTKILKARKDLDALVWDFYRNRIKAVGVDGINSDIIIHEVFDTAVNAGESQAGRIFQRAINVWNNDRFRKIGVDGRVGRGTRSAANLLIHLGLRVLLYKTLNLLQGAFYMAITDRRESQEIFLRGWLNNRVMFNVPRVPWKTGPVYDGLVFQRALNALNNREKYWPNLKVDGKIGPSTEGVARRAARRGDRRLVGKAMTILKGEYLITRVEADAEPDTVLTDYLNSRVIFDPKRLFAA